MDIGFINSSGQFRLRACAIIIENDCILMVKDCKRGYYYSVGGAVKQNETAEKAVVREFFEETGKFYEIDRLAFIHENFFTSDNGENGADLPFHEVSFYFLMKPQAVNSNCYTQFNNESNNNTDNTLEKLEWIPLKDYENKEAYPQFFKDKLKNMPDYPQHIVTIEE